MEYPRIYLAIDNCFASKRWTKPAEWLEVVKEIGINYVEASADNECDPMYMGNEYLDDWVREVEKFSEKLGVKVANLYSGHGTYATLGLAHTDERIRNRFLNGWLKPMVKTASKVGAGLGFFCHAFSDSVLQDLGKYTEMEEDLYNRFAELAVFAHDNNTVLGVEQMYTPHQIPWTIRGAQKLLGEVFKKANKPFYITIDLGHQYGQRKFLRPDYGKIKEYLRVYKEGNIPANMWLGPKTAYELFDKALNKVGYDEDSEIHNILIEMDRYPHMFSKYEDGDPYIWLEKLGCFSPIIHLQQTNGKSSSHLPFTSQYNENGIIKGDKVLKALYRSYQTDFNGSMPDKCRHIYLTLEMFTGTSEINRDTIMALKETVSYWRKYIPEDGTPLDILLEKTGEEKYA